MEPQTLDSDSHGESRLTSSSFAIRLGWSTQPENAGHLGSMLITYSKHLRARESDGEKTDWMVTVGSCRAKRKNVQPAGDFAAWRQWYSSFAVSDTCAGQPAAPSVACFLADRYRCLSARSTRFGFGVRLGKVNIECYMPTPSYPVRFQEIFQIN